MSAPTVWQYRLRTPKGAWLADVILRSDGFFATVSDWGNYAFRWTSPGRPFREFMAGLARAGDSYLCSKLGERNRWDGEGTFRRIREHILTSRREGSFTKEEAAKEWSLLRDVVGGAFRLGDSIDQAEFHRWHDETSIEDAGQFARYDYDSDLLGFCREVMPALAVAIRAELAAEQQALASAQAGGARP